MKDIKKPCPVQTTLSLIADKWKVLIIYTLIDGPKRPTQIKKYLGDISHKVLTENLRALERDKLVVRTIFPEVPLHVEYSLTKHGENLVPLLNSMYEWGNNYLSHFDKLQ